MKKVDSMEVSDFILKLKNSLEFAGEVVDDKKAETVRVMQRYNMCELEAYVPYALITGSLAPELLISGLVNKFASLHSFKD